MTVYESKKTARLGRIYKKFNKRPDGTLLDHTNWTVRYKGRDHKTGSSNARVAENLLLQLAAGGPQKPAEKPMEAIRMDEILDGVIANGKRKGIASARTNGMQIELHQRPFFGKLEAASLTSANFEEYTDLRLSEGAAPASVNRELALLKRALNVAVQRDPPQILRFPKINMLKLNNARKGFLSHSQYLDLKKQLPSYLVPVLVAGYHIGNRRGELLQVELKDIEMNAIPQPQFRLYSDATKNGEGRVIPIYGEMVEVFKAQIEMTERKYPACNMLFHNDGEEILTFYKAWHSATKRAGLEGLLFHDLRRTAVRNLTRAGVSRKVAMQITGHKTESVFDRYDITDEEDLRIAASKMTAHLDKMALVS